MKVYTSPPSLRTLLFFLIFVIREGKKKDEIKQNCNATNLSSSKFAPMRDMNTPAALSVLNELDINIILYIQFIVCACVCVCECT